MNETDTIPQNAGSIMHAAPPENVFMTKWHFLYVLQRMQSDERRFKPRGEWCLIPLGIFLSMGQAILTSEFKAGFGLTGTEWKSVAMLLCETTAVLTIALLVWWAIFRFRHHVSGPEEILNQITEQMRTDRERAASQSTQPVGIPVPDRASLPN